MHNHDSSDIHLRPMLAMLLAASLLSGCAEMHRGFQAIARVGSSPSASVEEAELAPEPHPDIKTVRPRDVPRAPVSEVSAADPVEKSSIVASAVPAPRQIFDFHPAGSAPGSFRQPFIIDPNDGPLTADVRRTAAELKAFTAAMKSGTAVAGGDRCGEMDVADEKPGCARPKSKVASTLSRNPLSLH
ncbi:hypothetical protein [Lichenibacterium dinghuense]|uniref:hypothetical protein n=1 Tax=Lichenibacterium dinghuense TaxID=2895977 RepID=UPI001F360734|nr:hypothetical protein [Lichenibacterium sp. 6Y81]